MARLHGPTSFYQGDIWEIEGTLYRADGSVMDLTGATAIRWRLEDAAGNVTFDFSMNAGISVTDAMNGKILITVTTAQSAALAVGVYRDQFEVTIDGGPRTMWTGTITVKKSFFAP